MIQCDQPCRFALAAFATGASFALDGFAFPVLLASDLTDSEALAARIAAAGRPGLRASARGDRPSTLLDGLNAVVTGAPLYDAARFAAVTLSAQTEAALGAGDLPRLNRLLVQDAYPDLVAAPSAKRVLRFPADHAGQNGIAVSIPAGATISKATLSTQEKLRGDRPGDPGAAATAGGRSGVHVSGDDNAAVSVLVAEAITATGLALPLLPLASGTMVSVELREDAQGAPAGEAARERDRRAAAAGERRVVDGLFRPGGARVGRGLGRAPRREGRGGLAGGERLGRPARRPRARRRRGGGDRPPRAAAALPAPLPQRQRGGGARDHAPPRRDGARRRARRRPVELRPGRGAAAPRAAGGTVQLTFTSTAGGTITVYPPHVEYTA